MLIVGFSTNVYAEWHPRANFGIYGIQHYATVAQYQQAYVGQIVQYLPEKTGGGFMDTKYFQGAGGKFNMDYVVSKISGNDKRMTWVLVEKGTNNKVKMVVNNQYEYFCFDKYCYCITDAFSIPLFLSEKFNADKANYIGKIYPENSDSQTKLKISDIVVQPQIASSYDEHKYPRVYFQMIDQVDGMKFNFDAASFSDLNVLGKVITNSKFKCYFRGRKVSI